MSQNMVTVNGVSVASVSSQPTHINIHIHQQSALTQLLKAVGSLKQFLSRPRDSGPSKARTNKEQLVLGVSQILLGVVSCTLGVSLYFGPRTELRVLGCAFWAGSVAIAAGAGTIVHEKHRGKLSGSVSGLLTLAGTAASVAATVFCVRSLIWQTDDLNYKKFNSVCNGLVPVTTTTAYRWRDDNSYWRTERCRSSMKMTLHLFLGFCILLTVVCILNVIVSLASLGLHLQSKRGQSSEFLDEEESNQKLLRVNPVTPSTSKEETLTVINL
ncbi:transmembrane protein 176B [Fukomys damarensis]|uniref:transmembrane protein 176B n=1 Tax=Fukomys damarensis TaxID=885580 RepID=UPI0005401526|nr:transmembrane protein 176B [Fukomys damarensis]XP_019065047.1 transmembrane protein 176B [Fukomys damarensis]XP_019065048.1 transmembrane protein 176B [Fukomys damarensis]